MIDIQYLTNYCEKTPIFGKKGDFPRISDGFSEMSVGSKGLMQLFIPLLTRATSFTAY